MVAPVEPRTPARLGMLSLAGAGTAGLMILLFLLLGPVPMNGFLTVMLTVGLALVPLSMGLSVAALLANGFARRRARREPQTFLPPKPAGLVMALVSFPLALGVFLLPALALSGGGNHARDKAAAMNLAEAMSGLEAAFIQARQEGRPDEERPAQMEAWLATLKDRRNPWRRGRPAFRAVVDLAGTSPAEARQQAVERATSLGEVVFVLSTTGPERCLAGAVLTKGLYVPPAGDPDLMAVPGGEGQVLVRSVLLAD